MSYIIGQRVKLTDAFPYGDAWKSYTATIVDIDNTAESYKYKVKFHAATPYYLWLTSFMLEDYHA